MRAGIMYKRAIAAGISDGFVGHFAAELRDYKAEHRPTEAEAELLHSGGFVRE
jgi:hypothetical protein